MADNIKILPSIDENAKECATDEVVRNTITEHQQIIKIGLGAEGEHDLLVDSGQQNMANSLPVVIASNQSAIPVTDNGSTLSIDDGGGSLTVDGTVTETNSAAIKTALELIDDVVVIEDAVSTGGEKALSVAGVRRDTDTSPVSADGDWHNFLFTALGYLKVSVKEIISVTLAAGSNAIGKLAANDGVDIGDVTVNNTTIAVTQSGIWTDSNSAAIKTSVELIDDTIGTDGSTSPTKGIVMAGQDGTNTQLVKTDSNGELQVDVLTLPDITGEVDAVGIQKTLTATPTISTSAYTANDNIGGLISLSNAIRTAGGSGIIQSLYITDADAEAPAMEIYFFNANPNTTGTDLTDNAVFDLADADLIKCFARVDIAAGDWKTFVDNGHCYKGGLAIPFTLAGTTLYVAIRILTADTFTATSDISIGVEILQN